MPTEEQTQGLPTVGDVLKKARTKAGLSVADVAANIHLDPNYIEGIEADDFTKLPQNLVFKRGYIRSYARVLKIPDDYIQQLLHAQGLVEVPVVKKVVQLERRQVSVRDKKVRWITYGIIGLLVILLISWWRSQMSLHHDGEIKAPVMTETTPAAPVAEIKPTATDKKEIASEKKSVESGNSLAAEAEKSKAGEESLLVKTGKHEPHAATNSSPSVAEAMQGKLDNALPTKTEVPKMPMVTENSAPTISTEKPSTTANNNQKSANNAVPQPATKKRSAVADNLNFDSGG